MYDENNNYVDTSVDKRYKVYELADTTLEFDKVVINVESVRSHCNLLTSHVCIRLFRVVKHNKQRQQKILQIILQKQKKM